MDNQKSIFTSLSLRRAAGEWEFWAALAMIGFWAWRMAVTTTPIGLVLFATSAVLPVSAYLMATAFLRHRSVGDEEAAPEQRA
ncbi:MAG: hypothetical protein ACFCGT_21015 [Sandaracinaceae bacterium]